MSKDRAFESHSTKELFFIYSRNKMYSVSVSIILIMGVIRFFFCMQETNMVEAISLRYMCTVFPAYNNSLSVTILNSQRSSQRPQKCSGFRSKSSFYCDSSVSFGLKIILPHSSSNFNDWPVKWEGDRYAL